jgi:hypothetical protein
LGIVEGFSDSGTSYGVSDVAGRFLFRMIHTTYARATITAKPTTAPITMPAMAPLVSPPPSLGVDLDGTVGAERGATPEAGLGSVVAGEGKDGIWKLVSTVLYKASTSDGPHSCLDDHDLLLVYAGNERPTRSEGGPGFAVNGEC